MSQAPDRNLQHEGQPVTADVQTMLTEYSTLRLEIERRSTVQWNVFALQLTSAGAVASLAISATAKFALLLIIPLSSSMLGGRYILHDFHIKLINKYIRDSLSGRLDGHLQWAGWKHKETSEPTFTRFGITRWNIGHPTRLAFEGVALLALTAAALSATYNWWKKTPHWALFAGFILIWAIGAAATWFLHQAFNRAAGT